jgi:hypothetical protein
MTVAARTIQHADRFSQCIEHLWVGNPVRRFKAGGTPGASNDCVGLDIHDRLPCLILQAARVGSGYLCANVHSGDWRAICTLAPDVRAGKLVGRRYHLQVTIIPKQLQQAARITSGMMRARESRT